MLVNASASGAIVRTGKRFDELVRADARCPNNRRGGNFVRAVDFDAALVNLRDARVVAYLDSFAAQTAHGVRAQLGMNRGENLVGGFDKQQAKRIARDAAIPPRRIVEKKILQIGEQFHAGVASANDCDGEQTAALGGIGYMVS